MNGPGIKTRGLLKES